MYSLLDRKQKNRFSLPSTDLHSVNTKASDSSVRTSDRPSAEQALKKSRKTTDKLSSTSTEGGLFGRLQRAFRRSASFDKRHSAYSRQSSGQLMKALTGLSAADLNPHIKITHGKRIQSFDSADHDSSSLPATHSMTSTGNPTPLASSARPSHRTPGKSHTSSSTSKCTYRIPLKIRDFTYVASDPRHQGLGEDGRGTLNIPRENRVGVIFKLLLDDAEYQAWKAAAITADENSLDSDQSDEDEDEDENEDGDGDDADDDEGDNRGWDGQWSMPSEDLDYEEEEEEEDAGPLSPGLYRALYPFVPEGSREMPLKEEQVVRVVGRGGGTGWAVVVVDGVDDKGKRRSSQKDKQLALVPESYLEPIALDEESS